MEAEYSKEVVEQFCECLRLVQEGLADVDHRTKLLADLLLVEKLLSDLI